MKFLAIIKKTLSVSLFLAIAIIFVSNETNGQDRDRVVKRNQQNQTNAQETQTRPTTRIPSAPKTNRQTLTNEIVVRQKETPQSLVRRTSQSQLTSTPVVKREVVSRNNREVVSRNAYSATRRSMMNRSIQQKIGIPYRRATQGPNLYDCSGFVWKVFQDVGINFTRTSARYYWQTFEPVSGDDRFEYGTLVFFNRLGHVGIVVDENGFYHASSSKGVTYSKFAGYWSKRIVGYRRIPVSSINLADLTVDEEN